MINAKKQRKTTEWERLEISLRKFKIPRTISCKDGHNKGQKWYDLTEAEDIKKRWQEYTEELYKKGLNDAVVIHIQPDILEYEVKLQS